MKIVVVVGDRLYLNDMLRMSGCSLNAVQKHLAWTFTPSKC